MKTDFDQLLKDSHPRLRSISMLPSAYRDIHPRLAHSHVSELEIYYAVCGSSDLILDCCPYHIRQNDLIVIDQDVIHDEIIKRNQNMDTFVISMSGVCIPGLKENQLVRPGQSPLIAAGSHSKAILDLMKCIQETNSEKYDGSADICERLLYILVKRLMMLLEESADNSREAMPASVRRETAMIKKYLDEHYMDDITLESVARNTNISASHISHIFKDSTGYSPIQYLTRRRLGEAETLLIHTDIRITDIATRCGYGTISNFNNSFQKYIGLSPGQYRKRHRLLQSFPSEHPTMIDNDARP